MAITISGTDGVGITGNVGALTAGTAVASTSGTSIDFTGIPSWVKRITVMFYGVSINLTSNYQIQIGSGSITTTGYVSSVAYCGTSQAGFTSTTGFVIQGGGGASNAFSGVITFVTLGSNMWASQGSLSRGDTYNWMSSGVVTLAGVLDRLRITTVNGTDTFDAGSINILYE